MADNTRTQRKHSFVKFKKTLCFTVTLAFFLQQFVLCSLALAMEAPESDSSSSVQSTLPANLPQFMPFKLGFEFQETHHLCPWAKSRYGVQKKSLFFMEDMTSEKPLWSVVIDGQDIEFVLEPFSDTEHHLLERAINSVLVACKPLTQKDFDEEDLLKAFHLPKIYNFIGKNGFEINVGAGLRLSEIFPHSFEIWKEWLKSHPNYKGKNDEDIQIIWNQAAGAPIPPDKLFRLAGIPPKKTVTFRRWVDETRQLVLDQNLQIREIEEDFRLVEGEPIKKLPVLTFQPQATIQYPLEYSVPLFFSLFGFEKKFPIISKLVEALPLLDDSNENSMEDYFTKHNGLIFLHALTLCGISSKSKDVDLLHAIQDRYDRTEQVDAKGTLSFMSRRPFSNMWRDISDKEDNFWAVYSHNMRRNKVFSDKFFKLSDSGAIEWVDNIHPNYAEEIKEGFRDLSFLTDYFTESFLNECKAGINPLPKLLQNGIVSTTMIRNLDPAKVPIASSRGVETPQRIFELYYSQSIRSVENPTSRYVFDVKKRQILEQDSHFDTLSPPLFLNEDDAMGFYKQSAKELDVKTYGEAIVEIRDIKRAYFDPGSFLTAGNEKLLKDVNILYSFLKQIHKEKVLSEEYTKGILKCTLKGEEN